MKKCPDQGLNPKLIAYQENVLAIASQANALKSIWTSLVDTSHPDNLLAVTFRPSCEAFQQNKPQAKELFFLTQPLKFSTLMTSLSVSIIDIKIIKYNLFLCSIFFLMKSMNSIE